MATTVPTAPLARPFLADVELALTQSLHALRGTYIGALLTGRAAQYQAMHQSAPTIPHVVGTPLPRQIFERFTRAHFAVRQPYREGLLGHPPHLAAPLATLHPQAFRSLHSVNTKLGVQTTALLATQYLVGKGTADSTTGINRWWTYEQGTSPGVGRYMVNTANGNLIVQSDDADVPERGIDLAFRRTYNSQSLYDWSQDDGAQANPYGAGWTNTFDAHITNGASGAITVFDIDGARYDYTPNAQGGFDAPAGMQGTKLQSDGACGYQWIKKSGTIYDFWGPSGSQMGSCYNGSNIAYAGRLSQIFGRNHNNVITFSYFWDNGDASTEAHLSKIVAQQSDGQSLTLTFQDDTLSSGTERLLASLTRPDGFVITYEYDSIGNLIAALEPGNGSWNNQARMLWYGYYDGTHRMLYTSSPRWANNSNWGNEGGYISYDWTADNRVLHVNHVGYSNFVPTDGADTLLQPSVPASPSQYGTLFLQEVFSYPSSTETDLTDTDGHATDWHLDGSGRVTETQEWTGAPNNLWFTTYASWDGNNNVTETVDARGNATDYGYDGNGNTIWVQQPWITTSLGYGRPVARYTYDGYNNLLAYCDPQYVWTTGATSCPTSGAVTHYTWNYSDTNEPYGYLTDTYTPMGYHHHIAYSTGAEAGGDYGLPTDVTGDCISQSDGSSRCPHLTMLYDGNGNVLCYSTLQDGNGTHWERASYDVLNRRVASADADDSSLSISQCSNSAGLPNSHIESTIAYYQNGQTSWTQSPSEYAAGVSTTYSYDADGNLISTTTHTGGVASTTTKWYDGADRLVEVQEPQDGSDAYGFPWRTRYIYDLSQNGAYARPSIGGQSLIGYGNLVATQECLATTSVTAPYSTKPTSCTFSNMETKGQTFDALDRLVKKYAWSGNALYTETLNYDGSGEAGLLSSDCKTSATTNVPCANFAYTNLNQPYQTQYHDPSTPDETYTYDPDGRTTAIQSSVFGTQSYSYDADGRTATAVEPNGGGVTSPATMTYHYYADGTRSSLDITSSALSQAGLFQYAYRQDGKLQSETVTDNALPSADTTITYQYTPAGRENALRFSGAGTPAAAPTYAYDSYGRLSSDTLTSSLRAYSMSYDPEGEITNYLVPNTGGTGTDTWSPQYSTRGENTETLENGNAHEQFSFANGVALETRTSTTTTASVTFDARMGVVTGNVGSKCITTSYGKGCPSMSLGFDGVGRMTSDVQQTPQKDDVGDIYYNSTNLSNTYDAENRLQSTSTTQTKGIGSVTSAYSAASYKWGPNGHPILVGTVCCASTTVTANDTLHWDGGQLLFTTDANGQVDDIKVGTLADITPIDPLYRGITFFARAVDHSIEACYNSTGAIGYLAGGGTRQPGPSGCLGSGSMTIPEAFATGGYNRNPVGTGIRALMYWRPDGLYDGINTIQGVRAYNSDVGGWTTPDAYAGNVSDPMSQKSYVWNKNNPVAYEDPSGYSAYAPEEYVSFGISSPHEVQPDNTQSSPDPEPTANGGLTVFEAIATVINQAAGIAVDKALSGSALFSSANFLDSLSKLVQSGLSYLGVVAEVSVSRPTSTVLVDDKHGNTARLTGDGKGIKISQSSVLNGITRNLPNRIITPSATGAQIAVHRQGGGYSDAVPLQAGIHVRESIGGVQIFDPYQSP